MWSAMIDQFGREIDYLRISITDRCNFRCVYCMPEDGVEQIGHADILTYDEIVRIVRKLTQLGIKKIKITGGEPTVRKNMCRLVRDIKSLPGIEQVTLTTNGYLLEEMAGELRDAGIDAINVSLDTLDPELFRRITRTDALDKVLRGLDRVLEYPDIRLKVNTVPLCMEHLQKHVEVASLAEERRIDVRFIEMMPLGLGRKYTAPGEEEIMRALTARYGKATAVSERLGNGPSRYVHFDNMVGRIGFISAVSDRFCDGCNRIRLTSDGFLKQCLHLKGGVDLRALIRGGVSDEELTEAMRSAIFLKPRGHMFGSEQNSGIEAKGMNAIGG